MVIVSKVVERSRRVCVRRNSVIGSLNDRSRHHGMLDGRGKDRLGVLGRTVHHGGTLVRNCGRDVLHDGSHVGYRRFLDDTLLVVDFGLGYQRWGSVIDQRGCMVTDTWTGCGQSKDR